MQSWMWIAIIKALTNRIGKNSLLKQATSSNWPVWWWRRVKRKCWFFENGDARLRRRKWWWKCFLIQGVWKSLKMSNSSHLNLSMIFFVNCKQFVQMQTLTLTEKIGWFPILLWNTQTLSYPTLTEKRLLSNLTLTKKSIESNWTMKTLVPLTKLVEFLVIVKETKPLPHSMIAFYVDLQRVWKELNFKITCSP